MKKFEEKINSVKTHFDSGDDHIGFRKLVDCALDTEDEYIYQEIICYTDWKHSQNFNIKENQEKINQLIEKIEKIEIEENYFEKPLLNAENIVKQYGKGKFKMGPISMNIHAGDILGLVGENGNGKTTLLRILANELNFNKGYLNFNLNNNISAYDLRTQLTYIPQRTPKWHGTLKSNLKLCAAQYGIKGKKNEHIVLMYMIRFGLWEYRDYYWDQLSSGYKMRFELARTFLRRPKILLLDEPLANLDVLAQQLILEDLKHLSQSISNPLGIILSSQQLFEVEKVSDKIVFLKNGQPTNLSIKNGEEKSKKTIIEIDINQTKENLLKCLSHLQIEHISFNGGHYIITINEPNKFNEVLMALVSQNFDIKYVRDISQSSRRLFV
jgi:ABC-2 type transport system ATP-binding protein